jgi:polyketide cyclase/dehydrase/lipid transport protein
MSGFTLTTRWQLPARIDEVAAILAEPERFPDWWPEVYLSVTPLDPGGPDGVGRSVAVHTRGWLPYTLRWQGRVVESRRPHGWTVEATGDLAGRGVWRLEQRGPLANITYDWRIEVEKPLLKPLTPLLKPLYAANHRWAMARGLEGLTRELARRAEASPRAPVHTRT